MNRRNKRVRKNRLLDKQIETERWDKKRSKDKNKRTKKKVMVLYCVVLEIEHVLNLEFNSNFNFDLSSIGYDSIGLCSIV